MFGISGPTQIPQGKSVVKLFTGKNINATDGSRTSIAVASYPVAGDVLVEDPYAHEDSGVGKRCLARPTTGHLMQPAWVIKRLLETPRSAGEAIQVEVEPISDAESANVTGSVAVGDFLGVVNDSFKLAAVTGIGSFAAIYTAKAVAKQVNASGTNRRRIGGLGCHNVN